MRVERAEFRIRVHARAIPSDFWRDEIFARFSRTDFGHSDSSSLADSHSFVVVVVVFARFQFANTRARARVTHVLAHTDTLIALAIIIAGDGDQS